MFSPSLSAMDSLGCPSEDLEADELLEELLQSCPPVSLDRGAMTAEGVLPWRAWDFHNDREC